MKGFQIFRHALRQVFGNFEGALRVSAVLYVAQLALGLLFLPEILSLSQTGGAMAMEQAFESGNVPWARIALLVIVSIILTLWIAVAWHRFVLLNERPALLPSFHGDRVLGYFLRGLWIGVILIPAGVVLGFIMGLLFSVFGPNPIWINLFPLLIAIPIWVIGMRLSAALPGAALGADGGVGQAWTETSGDLGAFIGLAVILAVLGLIANLIGAAVSQGGVIVSVIWTVGFGWVQLMVGVSILTTLYGHYIEKRALV